MSVMQKLTELVPHSSYSGVSAAAGLSPEPWAPSQYPKRRLSVRSRKVSKPRDWYFKLSYRFEIWQAHRQHCCRSACQISERPDNPKYKSRGFETLRDLTERRLFGYWDGALASDSPVGGLYHITTEFYFYPVMPKLKNSINIYAWFWHRLGYPT